MRITKYIKQVGWRAVYGGLKWLCRYSGVEFAYRKFNPTRKALRLPTGMLWLIGIYSAIYGIASQRYDNRVNEVETRLNT
ncbi:MAG: hypothetical protein ACE5G1_06515 [bacterium]